MFIRSSQGPGAQRLALGARLGGALHRAILSIAAVFFAAASGVVGAQAFTQDFDDITTLAGSGWFMQNNSVPLGTTAWYQGRSTAAGGPFDAWNGAANSYISADFNNTTGAGTISNWLGMPNRTLRNGDVFQFYTRRPASSPYWDRLEVRLSTNGASTNVGTTATAFGDFSTLLLSINPALVGGVYPEVWTQYTITITGFPAPTSGRMAFRYFVTNGGPSGTYSDTIGIDHAVYTPYVCPVLSVNPSTLSNGSYGNAYSQSLSQTGALGAPSYAVTAGALPPGLTLSAGGTISGTPTATATFNFATTVSDASGCTGSRAYSIMIAAIVPTAPQGVTVVAGDAQVQVNWSAPANSGDGGALTYNVSCAGGNTVNGTGAPPLTLTGLVNGTAYTCAVAATNSVGQGASGTSNTVTPIGNQTIAFGAQPGQTYSPGGTFAIDPPAIASSGLAVAYASTTLSVCAVGGATVSIVAAGTCTITADQPGDVAWSPAPQVQQSVTIAQASQTLAFPTQGETNRWFHAGATFEISPLASSTGSNSGEPITYSTLSPAVCSVSGTSVTMLGGGTCSIGADQAGNANYSAASQVSVQVQLLVPTEADLHVEATVDNDRPAIGDRVTYTITVGNDGEADTVNVRVQDAPPADRLDSASTIWTCTAAVATVCPVPGIGIGALDVGIASMPKNAALTFTLSAQVIAAANPANDYDEFFNTVTVALSAASGLTDPPANNASTVGVRVDDTFFKDGFELPVP